MTKFRKFAGASAMAAIILTSASPAVAAGSFSPEPIKASPVGPEFNEASEYYGRYRRHRRNRVDAGDIIAGIGLLAGIAIIADAASKSSKRSRDDRYRDRRNYPEQRRQQNGPVSDLGSAVSACSNAAESSAGDGARVEEIRSATRNGNGWRVSGDLSDNRSFDCGVDGGGVDFVELGGPRGAI